MSTTVYAGSAGNLFYNAAKTITDANHADGTVTIDFSAVHGMVAGDLIIIASVVGMTDINGLQKVASTPDTDTITITVTTEQSYTSGGTARNTMNITDWEANIETDAKNVTDSSSTYDENIPGGFIRASGSFSGFVLDGYKRPAVGSSYTLQLNYNATDYWSGTAIIISQNPALTVNSGEAVKITLNFVGTGQFAETNA